MHKDVASGELLGYDLLADACAIGTAETPAAPITGLIFPPESTFRSCPKSTPPAVLKINAISPNAIILRVATVRNDSVLIVAPTDMPRNIVVALSTSFWAAREALGASAFTEQVSEHQHPDKGHRGGKDQSARDG